MYTNIAGRTRKNTWTHIFVCTNEVEVKKLELSVYVMSVPLTSGSALTVVLSVFVSDRVERSTLAPVEEETAAEVVNVSQRRGQG